MRQVFSGVTGEITTLPGCTQVAVSHAVFVPPEVRGKGLGKWANNERCKEAHRLGYDYMMCTCDAANEAQRHVLATNGWTVLSSFKSRKTGHRVMIWGRELKGGDDV